MIINTFNPKLGWSLSFTKCLQLLLSDVKQLRIGYGLSASLLKVLCYIFIKSFVTKRLKAKEAEETRALRRAGKKNSNEFSTALMNDYLSGYVAECLTFPLSVILR